MSDREQELNDEPSDEDVFHDTTGADGEEGATAERIVLAIGGKVEAYYRVNLTHNSKSTNIETTASLKFDRPESVMAAFGGNGPDAMLGALLASAFDSGAKEALRRGKPLTEIQPMSGFHPIPEPVYPGEDETPVEAPALSTISE